MPTWTLLRTLLLALCCAVGLPAGAAETAFGQIGIVSRVGDVVSLVSAHEQTGSHLDRNKTDKRPLQGPALEHMVMGVAQDALTKALPGTPVLLLAVPEAHSAMDPERLLADGKVNLGSAWQSAYQKAGITHLVVITPHRAPAQVRFSHEWAGGGTLQGLGFYVDWRTPTQAADTGASGLGFLAPFAYVKLVLVDVAAARVVRETTFTESDALSAARSDNGGDPWGMVSTEQKMDMLRDMLVSGMGRSVPALLGAAP